MKIVDGPLRNSGCRGCRFVVDGTLADTVDTVVAGCMDSPAVERKSTRWYVRE